MSSIKFIYKLLFCVGLLFLLTACHSDYLSLDYRIFYSTYSDGEQSNLAVVLRTSAYKDAKGISRLPDGGQPEYLYRQLGIFTLDTVSMKLEKIVSLNDLISEKFNIDNSIKTRLTATDSCVYYMISPLTDWDTYLEWCKTGADSSYIQTLKEKYSGRYKYNKQEEEVVAVSSSEFEMAFVEKEACSLTLLNNTIDKMPVSELGLDLMDILPKAGKEYIAETIYLKNESALTRRAVVEQIISKLDREDIESLLKKMNMHKNSLEGYERTTYELYSRDTYKLIKELL